MCREQSESSCALSISVAGKSIRSSVHQQKEDPLKALNTNEKARLLDKFYTTHHTAAACLKHLSQALPDLQFGLYLEPSAGAGAFLTQLPYPSGFPALTG